MKYLTPIVLTMTFFVTLLASPGHSEEDPFTNVNCKAARTQLEMNYCADVSFKAADKELNITYQGLRRSLKQDQKKHLDNKVNREQQLIDAQLAWISYRDLDCKFNADLFKGGSIASLIYSGCQKTHTQQRTIILRKYVYDLDDV